MNLLKTIRKPYLSIFLSLLILFVSCEQYDSDRIERSFNYELYKAFKDSGLKIINFSLDGFQGKTPLEDAKALLNAINTEYGSDLVIPDDVLIAMFTLTDTDQIKSFVADKGLLNTKEISNLDLLVQNVEVYNLDIALEKLEIKIISENLTPEEFKKYEDLASILKITEEENPELFSAETARGRLVCLIAYALWVASLATFAAGCTTIILCALGFAGLAAASINVVKKCEGLM